MNWIDIVVSIAVWCPASAIALDFTKRDIPSRKLQFRVAALLGIVVSLVMLDLFKYGYGLVAVIVILVMVIYLMVRIVAPSMGD